VKRVLVGVFLAVSVAVFFFYGEVRYFGETVPVASKSTLLPLSNIELQPSPLGALRLEAGEGTLSGDGLRLAALQEQGSGYTYATGFDSKDDIIRWAFASDAGFYQVKLGYRSENGEKAYLLGLDGLHVEGRFKATNVFSSLNAGRYWLDSGDHLVTLGGGWLYYDIAYVELTPVAAPQPPKKFVPVPADEQLSLQARNLLNYLASEYGERTLSGQEALKEHRKIERRVGYSPAILSADLVEYSPSRIEYTANHKGVESSGLDGLVSRMREMFTNTPEGGGLTESLIQAAQQDRNIVTLLWHWNAPMHLPNTQDKPWWSGFYTRATNFDVAAALADTNSVEYKAILSDIDAIALQLKKMQQAGIPILWRPLHEPEGRWFWWGAKGPEAFKALWKLLFDRLTVHHQLHNLIWVLSSEDSGWYPGDEYVDIIGVDAYPADLSDPLVTRWDALIERYDGKKLIALTEFGGVPDINRMHKHGVWWSYFVSWTDRYGDFGPALMSDEQLRDRYSSESVITLKSLGYRAE